jgi:hypothetical protein
MKNSGKGDAGIYLFPSRFTTVREWRVERDGQIGLSRKQ